MIALLLAAAFACPDDQVIGLDLAPWKASLLADAPGSDEQHAEMAGLRMKAVPDGTDSEAACLQKPVVEGVDVFEANLTGEKDKLVQVRFRMCKGTPDEWQSLRLAVLVPLPERKWCLLDSDELAADRAPKGLPCGAKLPLTVSFKEVTQKGRKVIEVRDLSGSCEGGSGMVNGMLSLFEAKGTALKKIFETTLAESNGTAGGHFLVQKYKVDYAGKTFPKPIHVERCLEGAGCDVIGDFAYSKDNGKYVGK